VLRRPADQMNVPSIQVYPEKFTVGKAPLITACKIYPPSP